jgi:hypothetical protein
MRKSKDKSVELMMRILKMDQESAALTYEVFLKTLSIDGIPTRAGMDNLVKSIQAQGRFVDKKPTFSDVADDRLAKEVASPTSTLRGVELWNIKYLSLNVGTTFVLRRVGGAARGE